MNGLSLEYIEHHVSELYRSNLILVTEWFDPKLGRTTVHWVDPMLMMLFLGTTNEV